MSKIQSVAVFVAHAMVTKPFIAIQLNNLLLLCAGITLKLFLVAQTVGSCKLLLTRFTKIKGQLLACIQTNRINRASPPQLSKLISTETLSERKKHLIQLADAFLILPGGIGTLDELFEILTLNVLNIEAKPMVIVNTAGYYDHLLTLFKHSVDEAFTNKAVEQHLHSLTTTEELITQWRLA